MHLLLQLAAHEVHVAQGRPQIGMPQKALDAVLVFDLRPQNLEEFTNRVDSGWSALGAQLIECDAEVGRQR